MKVWCGLFHLLYRDDSPSSGRKAIEIGIHQGAGFDERLDLGVLLRCDVGNFY